MPMQRICHGIVRVRQVDLCSPASEADGPSVRLAGCAVLAAGVVNRRTPTRFGRRVDRGGTQPRWVMDGNYTSRRPVECAVSVRDTVIWFDLPRQTACSAS